MDRRVESYIRQARARGDSFRKITEDLKKQGVKSTNTGRPFTESAIKQRVYYSKYFGGTHPAAKKVEVRVEELQDRLDTVNRILETETLSADQKIEMLEIFLKK